MLLIRRAKGVVRGWVRGPLPESHEKEAGAEGLPQVGLWDFQWAFWQSREQYDVDRHFAQILRVMEGGAFWQLAQEMVAIAMRTLVVKELMESVG